MGRQLYQLSKQDKTRLDDQTIPQLSIKYTSIGDDISPLQTQLGVVPLQVSSDWHVLMDGPESLTKLQVAQRYNTIEPGVTPL